MKVGTMTTAAYTRDYFDGYADASQRSASVVLPIVFDLVRPASVVDVGCGSGAWLSVAKDLGVTDALGVDAGAGAGFMLPLNSLYLHDLAEPLRLERSFDLAISVEVAEHLPKASAAGFVESLTRLAPVVLFSAAIPFQGGTCHVNEQWPDYWQALFAERGYRLHDVLRRELWDDERVDWWYAQNAFLYADDSVDLPSPVAMPLRAVHPRALEDAVTAFDADRMSFRQSVGLLGYAARAAPRSFWRAWNRRSLSPS
jgi:SAM-dependent methyltransferase